MTTASDEDLGFLEAVTLVLDHLAPLEPGAGLLDVGVAGARRLDKIEAMEKAIGVMSPRVQQCFYLATVGGRSLPDMASMLGMPLADVAGAIDEARQACHRVPDRVRSGGVECSLWEAQLTERRIPTVADIVGALDRFGLDVDGRLWPRNSILSSRGLD